jgi:ABC-type Mn2+/Zn2+ transport system ATPase subunit
MNDPLITLDRLAVGYNGQAVLADISLAIARGSFTALLGANGSGKSTLLKTLLGLLPPVAGHLRVAAANGVPPVFGYVPQFTQFDPLYLLSGFEVALMAVYRRVGPGHFVPPAERALVRECLQAADAAEFAQNRFAELSGGQKQRVLMARALATRPDVLVLDEPTSGVDTAATQSLLNFISELHAERSLTILLATHDLPLVRRHAQQVVWLHDGKVIHGAASDLLRPERMAELVEIEMA